MKTRPLWLIAWLVTGLSLATPVAAEPQDEPADAPATERPHDPWVFRSILDGRARVVTIALHERLWVAYDAQHQGLYAAWPGGVKFVGAVYNYAHGPQPEIDHPTVYTRQPGGDVWTVEHDDETIDADVRYRGYELDGTDAVTLRYTIAVRDHEVTITETPSAVPGDGTIGLMQDFVVEGLPEGHTLNLKMSPDTESFVAKYSSAGRAEVVLVPGQHPDSPPLPTLRIAADGESVLTTTWKEQP